MAARKTQRKNSLRLIAGQWRGRKIDFPDAEGLRPTPDRVRETLFNWLQPVIPAAICVDCFAGGGGLGFEAASRGAKTSIMLDNNPLVTASLQDNKKLLGADNVEVVTSNAIEYLQHSGVQAKILFLDPPFSSTLLQQSLACILENQCLKSDGYIYLEYAKKNQPVLPEALAWYRQKQAGDVGFGLVRFTDA